MFILTTKILSHLCRSAHVPLILVFRWKYSIFDVVMLSLTFCDDPDYIIVLKCDCWLGESTWPLQISRFSALA